MDEPQFNGGDEVVPIKIKVPTYQGLDSDKVDFAAPLTEVTVENKCGLVLTLGELTGGFPDFPRANRQAVPELVCERRKNGWCIFIGPEVGGDHNMGVYIIDGDEPETFVVFDGVPSGYPEVLDMPPKEVDEIPQEKGVES